MKSSSFLSKIIKKNIFSLLFIIVSPAFCQLNIDKQLLNVEKNVIDGNYDTAKKELDIVLKSNSSDKLNQVKIYTNYVDLYCKMHEFDKALSYTNLAKNISDQTTSKHDDAYTNYAFAKINLLNQLYDKTVEYGNKALKDLKGFPDDNILLSKTYLLMSMTHSKNGIYSEEYKNYIDKSLTYALKSKEPLQITAAYSAETVLYLYKYLKSNDQVDLDKLFKSADNTLSYTNENNLQYIPKKALAISYNNMASLINSYPYKNLTDTERYNLAEDYINKAFEVSSHIKSHSLLSSCYATLGEIQENKGNKIAAESNYLKAYEIVEKEKKYGDLTTLNSVVQLLSNFYEKNNEPDKALKFNKEALKYTKQAYENTLENKRKFLEAYYNFEHKNQEIQQLTDKNKIYSKQIYLYIGIAILAIIGVIFLSYLIRYRHKINKQNTDLLLSEKNETELTLQLEIEEKARLKAEKELAEIQQEQLKKQALATSIQLNHKNSFINELKEKVKEENIVNLDRILKNERLSDNDFDNLHTIIKDVHPNFFKKLTAISKQKLTNQDLKYAAYIYLNMDNQKIADLLKVETKTVRMTKYRLKQKIGLEKEVDLNEFIQNLEV